MCGSFIDDQVSPVEGSEDGGDSTTDGSPFESMLRNSAKVHETHRIEAETVEEYIDTVNDADILHTALDNEHREDIRGKYVDRLSELGENPEEVHDAHEAPSEEELEELAPEQDPGTSGPSSDTKPDSIFDDMEDGDVGNGPFGTDKGGGVVSSTAFGGEGEDGADSDTESESESNSETRSTEDSEEDGGDEEGEEGDTTSEFESELVSSDDGDGDDSETAESEPEPEPEPDPTGTLNESDEPNEPDVDADTDDASADTHDSDNGGSERVEKEIGVETEGAEVELGLKITIGVEVMEIDS